MRNDRVVHLYANVRIQMYIELVECVWGKRKNIENHRNIDRSTSLTIRSIRYWRKLEDRDRLTGAGTAIRRVSGTASLLIT